MSTEICVGLCCALRNGNVDDMFLENIATCLIERLGVKKELHNPSNIKIQR